MRDFDGDAIAGELSPLVLPKGPPAWVARIGVALRIGIRAGFWPAAAVFLIYFALNHTAPLPWLKIAILLALYGPMVGVQLAVTVEALVMMFEWLGLRRSAPVMAGGLGGALAGILPGAIGVSVFGSYHGPFVGTVLIALALISGSIMVAIPLARGARKARGLVADNRAIATAAVISTLILCAIASVVAPIIVDAAFQRVRGAVAEQGARVGATAGVIGGGVVGIYVGLVIAIGRTLRAVAAPRDPSDPRRPSR